jgi:hypothetical protein
MALLLFMVEEASIHGREKESEGKRSNNRVKAGRRRQREG